MLNNMGFPEMENHIKQWGHHLTKTVQNGGTQPISEIHIEHWIVLCIETYLVSI